MRFGSAEADVARVRRHKRARRTWAAK